MTETETWTCSWRTGIPGVITRRRLQIFATRTASFLARKPAAIRGGRLTSGAVFTDLNGDGFPELALACEWGPIRLFAATRRGFRELTAESGLDGYQGWWNGVTGATSTGCQMDLAAFDWGLNTNMKLIEASRCAFTTVTSKDPAGWI